MRSSLAPALLAAVALTPGSSPATVAGETESSYGIGLLAGADSNPLLVKDDGPGGVFTQLRLNGGLTRYVGKGSTAALFASGRAAIRADGPSTADAGSTSASLRSGVALSPGFGGHRLVATLGGTYAAYRGTFTDRATGRVYEANVTPATDPATTVPIGDRLDYDHAAGFVNLRWKQSSRFTYLLDTSLARTDYVADYTASTDLDPLDFRSTRIAPRLRIGLAEAATLTAGMAWTDLDYDARPSLDADGNEVPGTRRRYRYAQLEVAAKVRPADRWNLQVGLAAGGRDDRYAGYYDNVVRTGFVSVEREIGERSSVRGHVALRTLDYDHATVTGDPDDPVQGSDEQRFVGRFNRGLGDRLRWYVEGGTEHSDSKDPVFSYDRSWVLTGIHFGSRTTSPGS